MVLLRSGHMSARYASAAWTHPEHFAQGWRPIAIRPRSRAEALVVEPLVVRQQQPIDEIANVKQRDGSTSSEQRRCHRVYLTVRPSEVDMYGVVGHNVYSDYLYTARVAFFDEMASIGMSLESMLEQNVTFATIKLHITFSGPLRRGERFYAESVLCDVKGASLKFEDRVVRLPNSPGEQEQLVCKADVRVAALAADSYRPTRIPTDVKKALHLYHCTSLSPTRAGH